MVLIERGVSVEQFDYSRAGGDLAILRLLTSLETPLGAPPAALLIVDPGPDGAGPFSAPACGSALERRLLSGGGNGGQLLWSARFAVPLTILEGPQARFRLIAATELQVALPAPRLCDVCPPALALERCRTRRWGTARIAFTNPRPLAALASAAVITGTPAPAVAHATGIADADASARVSYSPGARQSDLALTSSRIPAWTVDRPAPTKTTPQTPTTSTTTKPPTTTVTTPARTTTPTTTVTTPAPTTTAAPSPQPPTPRPLPNCHSRTHGATLTITPARATGRVKRRVGLNLGPRSKSCTPTSRPQRSDKGPAKRHPKKRMHRHPGTHPGTGSHPGSQAPRNRLQRVTGGAPLSPGPAQQPDHSPTPTPTPSSSSSSSSGGAAETPVPTLSSSPSFVPGSWTGTVTADPSLTGAVRNLAGLLANGNRPPSFLIPIYMQAGKRYDIPWLVLAAINAVESDYGRNLSTSSAGALGWMQFEPATWREYGVSADGHHNPNPYDPRDAIFSAARYLKAAGGSQHIAQAVYAYNHAGWYVDMVMTRARAIAHEAQYVRAKLGKRGTFSVYFATGLKKHPTVRYSGGVLSHYDRLIAAANMVSAANFPYLYGGGHEEPARWGPFDCSGSVSYLMQQAGYRVPTTVSGDVPSWKFPAGPGAVTIFYNPVHTFMRIGNRYFGTSGFARPGGGAGWFDVDKLPASYLATFREVHVPKLGANSFSPNARYVWPNPQRHLEVPLGLPRLHFRRMQR